MKTRRLSSIFLCFLLVFTLVVAAGCEKEEQKEEPKQEDKPAEVVDNKDNQKKEETKNNTNNSNANSSNTTKTVKLLKRNGVEWKENTKINSTRGAKSYKVVWGDTLSLIARTWKVNCYKLAKYNGIKNIDKIEVGQVIYNYAAKK